MNLEQALRNDEELVNQICTSTSTEKLLDYCKDKGYSISTSDLREAFRITDETTDDLLMGEIQKIIEHELTTRSEYSEDEELKSVSGGFLLAAALIGGSIIGTGGTIFGVTYKAKADKKAAQKQHEYTLELMEKDKQNQIELMEFQSELDKMK